MGKKIQVVCIASTLVLALVIVFTETSVSADAAVESRLARLESDSFQIRSQLEQIQAEIYRISGSQSPSYRTNQPPISVAPLPSRSSRLQAGTDPMFERLATLVIELKERVTALETRVNKLNKKVFR